MRLQHRLMMESGDFYKGMTALLIESGHGITGPGGLYGMNALSDYVNPTENMPCKELALEFGKALMPKMRRLRILPEFPVYNTNYQASIRFNHEPIGQKERKELINDLIENLKYIMSRKSYDKWALGSLTFKQAYHRDGFKGWGAAGNVTCKITPVFHFQSIMCREYIGGSIHKRALKKDIFVEQQKKKAQIIKEFEAQKTDEKN